MSSYPLLIRWSSPFTAQDGPEFHDPNAFISLPQSKGSGVFTDNQMVASMHAVRSTAGRRIERHLAPVAATTTRISTCRCPHGNAHGSADTSISIWTISWVRFYAHWRSILTRIEQIHVGIGACYSTSEAVGTGFDIQYANVLSLMMNAVADQAEVCTLNVMNKIQLRSTGCNMTFGPMGRANGRH
jgi:hypothetical protein